MTIPQINILPVSAVFDDVRRVLGDRRNAVLQAPTGAGKTTGVPLALLTLSLIHISEPTRLNSSSRKPSSA